MIPLDKTDVFYFFGFKDRTGWDNIKPALARTFYNRDILETRGRKHKLSRADVREAGSILEEVDLGLDAKGMGCIGLVWKLDLDVHPYTLQRTIRDAMIYRGYSTATKVEPPSGIKTIVLNYKLIYSFTWWQSVGTLRAGYSESSGMQK